MTFSLTVGHLETELKDQEILEFFDALESEGLLPGGVANVAINTLQQASEHENARTPDAWRMDAELRAWIELDSNQLPRLLQLDDADPTRRAAPLDEDLIYAAGIDAIVSALLRVGSPAERNNLHHFIRTNRMGESLTAVLMEMRSSHAITHKSAEFARSEA